MKVLTSLFLVKSVFLFLFNSLCYVWDTGTGNNHRTIRPKSLIVGIWVISCHDAWLFRRLSFDVRMSLNVFRTPTLFFISYKDNIYFLFILKFNFISDSSLHTLPFCFGFHCLFILHRQAHSWIAYNLNRCIGGGNRSTRRKPPICR